MLKIIGYILLGISILLFIAILIIPWLGFSKNQVAGLITGLFISAEVLFYLSIFILGKSLFSKIKNRLMFWKPKQSEPVIPEQND